MSKFIPLVIISLLVMGCATASKYPANSGFNKKNFSYSSYAKDGYECGQLVNIEMKMRSNLNHNSVAGDVLFGFMDGYNRRSMTEDALTKCFIEKGYKIETLTTDEINKRIQASKDYYAKMHPEN